MTVLYLRSTGASPTPTDPSVLANDPTGAGVFVVTGSLLPSFSGSSTGNMTLSNLQHRSYLFTTAAGVPGLTTIPTGTWRLVFTVTALDINAGSPPAAAEFSARILVLDSSNVVTQAGNRSGVSTVNLGVDTLPVPLTITIPTTTFSAGSSTDRVAVQLVVREVGTPTNITVKIQLDDGSAYLEKVGLLPDAGLKLVFATSFGGDITTGGLAGSMAKHNLSVRNGDITQNNNVFSEGTGHTGFIAPGILGLGKTVQAPGNMGPVYTKVSPLDVAPTACDFSCVFRFTSTVTSQSLFEIGGSGQLALVRTTAADKLEVLVGGVAYTASSQTLSVNTAYGIEIVFKVGTSADCAFSVRLSGLPVAGLLQTAATSSGGASITSVNFPDTSSPNIEVGEIVWRVGDTAYSESLFMAGATGTGFPRVSDLFAVADGNYLAYCRITGTFPASCAANIDSTYANDYQQINETSYDHATHRLGLFGGANDPQSWIYGAFADGTTPVIVSVFQHIICGGSSDCIGVQFLRIAGTDYIDPTLQNLDTTNNNQWGSVGGEGMGGCSMNYDTNPDTTFTWTVSDLAALEGGIKIVKQDGTGHGDATITQAVLSVVWIEGPAVAGSDYLYTLPMTGVGW